MTSPSFGRGSVLVPITLLSSLSTGQTSFTGPANNSGLWQFKKQKVIAKPKSMAAEELVRWTLNLRREGWIYDLRQTPILLPHDFNVILDWATVADGWTTMNLDEHRRTPTNTEEHRNPSGRSEVKRKKTYWGWGSSGEAPHFSGAFRVMQRPELRSETKVDGGGVRAGCEGNMP